ncbi:MAG: cytochrome P450 [Acidobacteriota bacterium]
MIFPQDPLAAVTHPDPYAYYANLVTHQPLYYDKALGAWVAASAQAVTAVLTNQLCRVRPPTEPVPRALLGSPAAAIFQHLVRMNDGAGHCPFKQAVAAALASLDAVQAAEQSRKWAQLLSSEIENFAFHLPVYVMGSLVGVPQNMLHQTALWMSDFVRCLAPASNPDWPDQIERGKVAAGHLMEMFRALLADQGCDGLLQALARTAKQLGREDPNVIVANGIGFLFQPYEATAGLIGNTLLALAARPELREQVIADSGLLREVMAEVLRYDSPVQNTRRFLAEDGIVAGLEMKAGDMILVVLAAANRDPLANPDPDRFDIFRKDRKTFTFGAGLHACPGESLAITIAKAGVEQLLASGVALEPFVAPVTYRASANVRIPLLALPATPAMKEH